MKKIYKMEWVRHAKLPWWKTKLVFLAVKLGFLKVWYSKDDFYIQKFTRFRNNFILLELTYKDKSKEI